MEFYAKRAESVIVQCPAVSKRGGGVRGGGWAGAEQHSLRPPSRGALLMCMANELVLKWLKRVAGVGL